MKRIFSTRHIWLISQYCCILFLASSCKKLISIDPSVTQLTTVKVFTNDNTADAVIASIYGTLSSNNALSANTTSLPAFSADELNDFDGIFSGYFINNIPTNDGFDDNNWAAFYNIIYRCNSLLEGLQTSSGVTVVTKNQLSGEAMFIRAFCYFELINFYGDVPLLTTTDVTITAKAQRTAKALVYQQIVADLKAAQGILSDTYVTTERVRVNKSSATALLARVYLYEQDWSDAIAQATTVINDSQYSLVPNLNSVFLENSTETILQIWGQGYTALGSYFIPSSSVPHTGLTASFMNSIELGDQRASSWINSIVIGGITYYYPYKYKLTTTNTTSNGEYLMVLRLAEQYLIRAEANAQPGGNLSLAIADLNVIRNRAGLPNTTAATQIGVLTAIYHERRVELFTEWGHRWFDLKRTNMANTVLAVEKGTNWSPDASLYPIPLVEINANPNLVQNPGYQ